MAASSCGFGLLPPAVEPPAVESFGAALLGIERLPRACTSTQEEFGMLKSYVQSFPDVFGRLLPVIEQVLWKLCTSIIYITDMKSGSSTGRACP